MKFETGIRQSGKTYKIVEDLSDTLISRIDRGVKTPMVINVVRIPVVEHPDEPKDEPVPLTLLSGKTNVEIKRSTMKRLYEKVMDQFKKGHRTQFGGLELTLELTEEEFRKELSKFGYFKFVDKDLSVEEVTLSDLINNDENTYYVIDDVFRYDNTPNVFITYLEEDKFPELQDPTISDLKRKALNIQKAISKLEEEEEMIGKLFISLSKKIDKVSEELKPYLDINEIYVETTEGINGVDLMLFKSQRNTQFEYLNILRNRVKVLQYKLKHISDSEVDKITNKDSLKVMKSMIDSIQVKTDTLESILLKEMQKK